MHTSLLKQLGILLLNIPKRVPPIADTDQQNCTAYFFLLACIGFVNNLCLQSAIDQKPIFEFEIFPGTGSTKFSSCYLEPY